MYIRQNIDPTRINYQYADLGISSEFDITIQNPGDEDWHIGIYGWNTCSYHITADVIEECQCTSESHGTCSGSNQCICDLHYAGELCTIPVTTINNGHVLSEQYVEPQQWTYYSFVSDSSIVTITMEETSTSGDLFLAVSLSGYPTGENFDYYDVEERDYHEVQMSWQTENIQRVYFIGVLTSTSSVATDPVEFSITAYGTPF